MGENQRYSAATGGVLGTDDALCYKVRSRDRLKQERTACLSTSTVLFIAACPGDPQGTPESSDVLVELKR